MENTVVHPRLATGWRRLGCCLLLAGLAWPTGCRHAQPPLAGGAASPAAQVVLDYGNGWYHTATGKETIGAIAARYQREAALVALLNKSAESATPAAGTMLYIPPTNDRVKAREVLLRVREHPESVPKTPWLGEAKSTLAAAQIQAPAARKPAVADIAQPASATPQAGAVTVKQKAETKAADKANHHWFASLLHGEDKAGKTDAAVTAALPAGNTMVARAPAGDATGTTDGISTTDAVGGRGTGSTYQWPAEGQVVTKFSGGWQQSCHGIEIAAPEGAPVRAARAGRVLMARKFMSYGNLIVVDHGDGYATAYGFNQTMLAKEGEQVRQGQQIATVGRQSQGSASKLFFQVRRNALPVDPMQFLK